MAFARPTCPTWSSRRWTRRADRDYLSEMFAVAIEEGDDVERPDTVGYTTPEEYAGFITYIKEHTPGFEKAVNSQCTATTTRDVHRNSLAKSESGLGRWKWRSTAWGAGRNTSRSKSVVWRSLDATDYGASSRRHASSTNGAAMVSSRASKIRSSNKAVVGANNSCTSRASTKTAS